MHEYYIGEIKVTLEKFSRVKQQLDLSNMDWEIDYSSNRTTIYICEVSGGGAFPPSA